MAERTITFPDDLKPKWIDRFVADVQAHIRGVTSLENETYPAPHHGWICFHCGERFTTKEGAAIHFGTANDERPVCVTETEGWKPIETALKNADVLVSTDTSLVGEARYFADEDSWWWAGSCPTDYVDRRVDAPTHWQPLPAPPLAASPSPGLEKP